MTETQVQHYDEDGALYTVDVIRDRRDEANPHYDVDLVRSLTGRFGESIEQRLTLAEYDQRAEADVHRNEVERAIYAEGLDGVGDAKERILKEPVLYDGSYLFVTYPPDAEGTERSAAYLLHLNGETLESDRVAVGTADEMALIAEARERDWADGKLPNALAEPERHSISDSGFTRDNAMSIHDAAGREWVSHLDAGDTSHWFAIVESEPEAAEPAALPYELRYFRALQGEDGAFKHDSYPVMPLPDDQRESAWPLPGLEMYLTQGDVYMAQQFAHDVADNNGMDFPPPMLMPALDPEPDYYFGYGVSPNNQPSLEAVKTWMDGTERRFDTFTIAEYGMYEEARVDEQELDDVMRDHGLEAAMNLAERMAVASGYLHDVREDARLFTEGPPDPFMTNAERDRSDEQLIHRYSELETDELPVIERFPLNTVASEWIEESHREREANAHLEGAAWFEARFDQPERELLYPLDDTVNYGVVVQDIDPWTTELVVEKYWKRPNGYLGIDSQTIQTFDSDDDAQRQAAEAAREGLLEVYDERGLEAMMHRAEMSAVEHKQLYRDRLFRDGPPDRFETLAQQLAEAPAPGSWDELVAQQPDAEPEPERHYWQMHYRPVETPDGEPLGTALFVTEFPQLAPDFAGEIPADTAALTLEMAHFANDDEARKFEKEFRSYLIPDLIDGPELAPEVAKLEGLSGEWMVADPDPVLVREVGEWHLHNPHAEREARDEFERLPADRDL